MKPFDNVQQMSSFLLENGIKPSFQRVKIFERLNDVKDHPTVGEIYSDLIVHIPSLSKTTVYNTLNLFIKQGIVRSIGTDANEARYDSITHSHGHFICNNCGKIYDIQTVEDINLDFIQKDGHKVSSIELNIRGICKNCIKK